MSILCEIFDGFCEIWIIIDFFNKIGERGRFLFGPYVRHFSSKYVFRWRWYFHCNFIFLETGIGKDVIFQKLTDFGSNYGTIEFPPMLTPIPAKPTLFDIAGDKGLGFHICDDFLTIFDDFFWPILKPGKFSIFHRWRTRWKRSKRKRRASREELVAGSAGEQNRLFYFYETFSCPYCSKFKSLFIL